MTESASGSVPSTLVQVTVFSDRAHLTRRARTEVGAGRVEVTVADLPRSLDAGEVRVVPDRGAVQFLEVIEPPVGDETERDEDALERAVEDAERNVHRLTGQLDALVNEIALIDRVVPGGDRQSIPPGGLRPDVFLAALDTLMQRRKDALYTSRVAEYQLHLAQEELEAALVLWSARGRRDRATATSSALRVVLDGEDAGPIRLDVTHTAGWATWRPAYAVRIDAGEGRVELVRFADVWQQTGRDWDGVQLRLSTAQPEDGLQAPEVAPWILERRKTFSDQAKDLYRKRKAAPLPPPASAPPAPSRFGAHPTAPEPEAVTGDLDVDDFETYAQQFEEEGIFAEITSSGLALAGAARSEAPLSPSERTQVVELDTGADAATALGDQELPARHIEMPRAHPELSRFVMWPAPAESGGGLDYTLDVDTPVDVESGGSHQRLNLGSRTYPARLQYIFRPAVRDHAFGRVELVNQDEMPVLAGPCSLYVADAFCGTTRLETTPPGGRLELDLGAETNLKCARRVASSVRTEGILTREDVHVVRVTTEIESYLDVTAAILVEDQVPVSRDSRVRVKVLETVPGRPALDESTGILQFKAELPPGGRLETRIVYEIEAPKDYQLIQELVEG